MERLSEGLEPWPAAGSNVKELADKVVKGKRTVLKKACAVYTWIVAFPYAEADGKMLDDDLAGLNLRYKISYKEEWVAGSSSTVYFRRLR